MNGTERRKEKNPQSMYITELGGAIETFKKIVTAISSRVAAGKWTEPMCF